MTPEQITAITWTLVMIAVCSLTGLIISIISLAVSMKAFKEALER